MKYSVDITMDCMVLHVTKKYTKLKIVNRRAAYKQINHS